MSEPYTQTDPLQALNDLLRKGWCVSVFRGGLGTPTAVARRGKKEIDTDGFHGLSTRDAILAVWDKVHSTGPYKKRSQKK